MNSDKSQEEVKATSIKTVSFKDFMEPEVEELQDRVAALLEGLEEAKEALEQCQDYAVIYNNAVPATLCKEALKSISALLSTEAQGE